MAVASSDEFTRVIRFLSKNIVPSPSIVWGSEIRIRPPRQYEIIDHARTVISFMDSLGIKKASIAGQFFGAEIAVELAVNWPDRINKVILAGAEFWKKIRLPTFTNPTTSQPRWN